MPSVATPEQIQDVADCARYGDLEELTSTLMTIAGLKTLEECRGNPLISSLVSTPSGEARNSPLHMAAGNGHLPTVKFILPLLTPALINAQNAQGSTALHWAALNGHLEIAQALLAYGADATIKNDQGRSSLTLAEQQGHLPLAQELLKSYDPEESLDDDAELGETEETAGMDLRVSLGPNGELRQEFVEPKTGSSSTDR